MFHLGYSPTAGAAAVAVLVLGYVLYRAALPRPLPGIPYHRDSAARILGDAPAMVKHREEHGTVTDWMTRQGSELNSPVFQLFLNPFTKPGVYVLDPRETQDVLLRRAKDFDRSKFFADVFIGTLRHHHIVQPTNEKFRRGRRLLADTMGSGFLNGVAAPSIHRHTLKLLALWRVKKNLAAGHAFRAAADLNHFALDSIWDTALGSQLNAIGQKTDLLKAGPVINIPSSDDEAVEFPEPEFTTDVRSMKILTGGLDKATVSPLPRQTHWLLRQTASYRRATADKEHLVQASLNSAKARLLHTKSESTTAGEFAGITCATDHMVRREAQAAAKEKRAPEYDSPQARDELFGFLVGGHDTTATTLMWMMKLLADHADVQATLRAALASAFAGQAGGGTVPTPEQITKLSLAYLDAVLEEVVRCAQTAQVIVRKAVRDTQVLGHHIPKGVDVYFMVNGPGYTAPNDVNAAIPEAARSASSRENKDRAVPGWDAADVGQFKPARWLKTDGEGRVWYDGQAGPCVQFGGGLRGCFGRKLAYVEMRIVLVLLLWTYEVLPVPEQLGSYAAFDSLTHKPKLCYLRLREIGDAEEREK